VIGPADEIPPYSDVGRPRALDELDQEQRERVLRVATDVFTEHGYRDTTLEAIAASAGVPVADLDELFESKAALLVEAAGRQGQAFFASVLRALGDYTPSVILTRLMAELQASPPTPMYGLWSETLVSSLRDAEVRRHLDPHLRYAKSAIEVVVRAAKDDGFIAADVDVDATVHACVSLMFGSCIVNALGIQQPTLEHAWGVILKFVDGLGMPSDGHGLVDLREPAGAEVIELSPRLPR
jgi:AcrR family transcriptional regulator